MHGINAHTHQERTSIINQLIPLLKIKFKDNFVALAADGSYARKEDTEYSDLELIVFLTKIPQNVDWNIHKIVDGQLIVIVYETKDSYIHKFLDISEVWYASGASPLLPLVNPEYIRTINSFVPTDKNKKCLEQILKRWPGYQEITAKLLNNIRQKKSEAIPLVFPAMIKDILVILSFLNQIPYKTMGSYIPQAKTFAVKPNGFDTLLTLTIKGDYLNLELLEKVTMDVFTDLEETLERKGLMLYSHDLASLLNH